MTFDDEAASKAFTQIIISIINNYPPRSLSTTAGRVINLSTYRTTMLYLRR